MRTKILVLAVTLSMITTGVFAYSLISTELPSPSVNTSVNNRPINSTSITGTSLNSRSFTLTQVNHYVYVYEERGQLHIKGGEYVISLHLSSRAVVAAKVLILLIKKDEGTKSGETRAVLLTKGSPQQSLSLGEGEYRVLILFNITSSSPLTQSELNSSVQVSISG